MRRHVYFFTHVETGYDAAAERFAGSPGAWLPAPATPADDEWLVDLCADGAVSSPWSRWPVLADVGLAADTAAGMGRRLRWKAASRDSLFPVLLGDLELSPLHSRGCQLSLMGAYRPPLSVIGAAGDALMGHRVAEACVRRFVLDVAARLAAASAVNTDERPQAR